jgi:hypothetical protein
LAERSKIRTNGWGRKDKKKKTGISSLVHGAPSPLGELNPLLNRKKKPNEKKLIIKKV